MAGNVVDFAHSALLTGESLMRFARRDDCLDMMVPSDLRAVARRMMTLEERYKFVLEDNRKQKETIRQQRMQIRSKE